MVGECAGLTVDEAVQRARSGELKVWQCDMRIGTRDGQTRWIADTAVEVLNEQGISHASLGILQDITDRKRIEHELRLSEERYRLVSSVISDYTFSSVLDERGAPLQRRGLTSCPNVYFLGLHWMYKFKSAILAYVVEDAAYLADHIAASR